LTRLHEHGSHPSPSGPDVADRAELKAWQARLEELGIPHGGIVDAHYGSSLSFRDPDNIALELFAPPG
jgi:glyoxylase I family protein